jgi:hypothetical protein
MMEIITDTLLAGIQCAFVSVGTSSTNKHRGNVVISVGFEVECLVGNWPTDGKTCRWNPSVKVSAGLMSHSIGLDVAQWPGHYSGEG